MYIIYIIYYYYILYLIYVPTMDEDEHEEQNGLSKTKLATTKLYAQHR